ncbi:hypothetical protein Echvi_2680 [Echinicola vietnamensis DSM 17526]|uniref:Uncharacterized protein n=1 Tax=Echinicola vietnamensis (strain DSM 17526 / LMG 23754 / KMM 6221) TaxID=926556 RepID=L0G233_ECHVK|nr:hypothetical protein Echvi_2680 [Echinicola vietnamensis DSM 17526]
MAKPYYFTSPLFREACNLLNSIWHGASEGKEGYLARGQNNPWPNFYLVLFPKGS